MRSRIDVSEIEATTKIRAKYLRALENEEWGLLPGPTFVKSFLRTYAEALGLDGKALVEEYRLSEEPSADGHEPIVSTPGRSGARARTRTGGGGPSRGYLAAVGVIGAIIVLLIVLLVVGGGSGGTHTASTTSSVARHHASTRAHTRPATHAIGVVSLALRPTGLVYVCLLGDRGRVLIPSLELKPGESTPTYHARRFEITLGNSSVLMIVDGITRTVKPSSQAIGFSITKASGRQPLAQGQLPTCK